MTILMGQTAGSTPVTESVQGNGGDVCWRRFTAVATGTATSMNLRIGDWAVGTATGVKGVVYDSSGNRLAISSIFAPADGIGLLNKAISFSSISGQDYDIVLVPDTGYISTVTYHDLTGVTVQYVAAGGFTSYSSPPATIPASSGPLSRFPLEVWIDGTIGGLTRPQAGIGTGGMNEMSGGMQGKSAHAADSRSRIVVPSNFHAFAPRNARHDLRV